MSTQLTPTTPKRRWGTPTDASAAMVSHRLLSSATRSNDDNDLQVHSFMFPSMISAVFLCDDHHLLFPVVWLWQRIVTADMTEPG